MVEALISLGLGVAVAMLNSLAGGGSSLSLPAFIFMGIPPGVANGTNRFGLIWGNFMSFYGLYRQGQFDFQTFKPVIIPIVLGASVGAYLAVLIPDKMFEGFLAMVLLGVAVLNLTHLLKGSLSPSSRYTESPSHVDLAQKMRSPAWSKSTFTLFTLVGFYGGFIQVGVGFVMIFAFSKWSGSNLLQVNAIKSGVATLFMMISFGIFFAHGKIKWDTALIYAIGCIIGGYVGASLQVYRGESWVKWVMISVCLGMSIKLISDLI